MRNFQAEIRRVIYRTMNPGLKTEGQAEAEIQNSILALGLPLIATHVEFLPGKGRWVEVAALVNGEPVCVELLTQVR